MKPYFVFSKAAGPSEWAILIFAHSAREARKLCWQDEGHWLTDDYLDFVVHRTRNQDWLFEEANQEMLTAGIPHVVDNPRTCSACLLWGQSPIGVDGLCEDCRSERAYKHEEY